MAKPVREEAIVDILVNSSPGNSMGIADLGCSSGPTALSVISAVTELVRGKCGQLGQALPELRLYLNDLPLSDFNSVFGSLPGFYEKQGEFGKCFVMGVPGSFYGRLFPSNSLHFVHSSSSLHWLSQVPAGLEGKAKNKGKLYISKTSPQSVVDAYALQFQKDFSLFLKSRSAEVVAGGGMALSLMGRRPSEPASADSRCYQWELLAQSLMQLVEEGCIDEEKIDSFNAPYYAPSPEELEAEIEMEGSFVVKRLEAFEVDWDGGGDGESEECINTIQKRSERVAKMVRAVTESMLECHFGRAVMDDLFKRFVRLAAYHLSKTRATYINLVISLVKK